MTTSENEVPETTAVVEHDATAAKEEDYSGRRHR